MPILFSKLVPSGLEMKIFANPNIKQLGCHLYLTNYTINKFQVKLLTYYSHTKMPKCYILKIYIYLDKNHPDNNLYASKKMSKLCCLPAEKTKPVQFSPVLAQAVGIRWVMQSADGN
jgi:hypothetical protein